MKTYANAIILTMDQDLNLYNPGYISIQEDKIVSVGPMDQCPKDYEDMKSKLIMPGFINGHTHLGLIFLRGMADDVKDRLRKFLFPMENTYYDQETVEIATEYAAYESLLSGVTTVFDMYYYSKLVADILHRTGIRAIVGQTIIRNHELAKGVDEAYLVDFIEKNLDKKTIYPALSPHAPYSLDKEDFQIIKKLSKKYKVLKMMHIGEMDFEMKMYEPNTPFQYMDELGFIDERFIGVHAIHTRDCDLEILKSRGASLVSCPCANMKSAKGIPNILAFLEKNIPTALGSDGPVSGNTLDLNTVMKVTGFSQKLKAKDRTAMKAKDIVKLATCDGAKALHLNDVGSLSEGYQADLIVVDTGSLSINPIYDIYNTIVYSMSARDVEKVLVAGKVIVEDKAIKDKTSFDDLIKRYRRKNDYFQSVYRQLNNEI